MDVQQLLCSEKLDHRYVVPSLRELCSIKTLESVPVECEQLLAKDCPVAIVTHWFGKKRYRSLGVEIDTIGTLFNRIKYYRRCVNGWYVWDRRVFEEEAFYAAQRSRRERLHKLKRRLTYEQ